MPRASDGAPVQVPMAERTSGSGGLRSDDAPHTRFLISLAGGRLHRLQSFDRPALGNDPTLRLSRGDEEDFSRARLAETVRQNAYGSRTACLSVVGLSFRELVYARGGLPYRWPSSRDQCNA
jgi:hypothetical protein